MGIKIMVKTMVIEYTVLILMSPTLWWTRKMQSRFGNTSINSNSKSTLLPRDEWNKITQEQKDSLITKRRQELMGNKEGARKPFQSPRQVNAHNVNYLVCIDDIIDYTIMNHEVNNVKVDDDNKYSGNNGYNALLAFMAGQGAER
jgi:hypothetical protein